MDNTRTLLQTRPPARRTAHTVGSRLIRLAAGECWSPRPEQPVTLLCTEGTLWWTQSGDARDHLLRSGDPLTVATRDRIVIQALTPAALRIEA